MNVLKFGGTSIGTPERMRHVAGLLKDREAIVVLSAVANTTDKLSEICRLLITQKRELAVKKIETFQTEYHQFVESLFSTDSYRAKGNELIDSHFEHIRSFTLDMFTSHEQRTILAQGELISSSLLQFYLEECKVQSVLLPALDFMRLDEKGEPNPEYVKTNLKTELAKHPGSRLFITQGYICRNAFGEIDNLKRGGSDTSASLIGAAIQCDEIQIWTDIDGMHNNDPRYVKNTESIQQLSFDEAAELAYFGAKILHPSSIGPARKFDIPVRLLNTMKPEAPGTLITGQQDKTGQIKAVAAKDGIMAIKIKSSRMLLAYGFLRRVFEVFERYKTPIDMISTSEVAVSLTIDDSTYLESIKKELEEFGTVEIDHDQAIICVVGDFVAESKGFALQVLEALKEIPIRMICYGGSRHNISLLVQSDLKVEALNALHKGLFGV
ncbi:aspartate kinase [candidate division KSB1 bacterium]|nr:aspartate kinase [candidate division KSB1 bacterium]